MLNLALVGLLAGSLATGSPDGDRDKDKNRPASPDAAAPAAQAAPAEATPLVGLVRTDERPLVLAEAPAEAPEAIVNDTYSMGRLSPNTPIAIYAEFAFGETEELYGLDGEDLEFPANPLNPVGADGADIIAQRFTFGAQLGVPVSVFGLGLGVGAQFTLSQNKYQPSSGDAFESGFEPQFIKVYGTLRGRALGIHGGYMRDLGEATSAEGLSGGELGNSSGRDALNFGLDFDYPGEGVRLFAGVDYFKLYQLPAGLDTETNNDDDDILFWTFGLGLRFGIAEIGAALHYQTQFRNGRVDDFQPDEAGFGANGAPLRYGSHVGTVAPYLRLSPGFFPASLYVRGAVLDQYTEYGYGIGGANEYKPSIGFTVGLSVGFE